VIRVVLADDEPLARAALRRGLAELDDVELVGEAQDGPSAVETIVRQRPDLLLLDVQLPGFDGFEVVARVRDIHLPTILFVSAYDRYALRAFDVHAVDYLLKPFSDERFTAALQRARAQVISRDPVQLERLLALLSERAEAEREGRHAQRFTVREKDVYRILKPKEIDWIESAGNYAQLHVAEHTYLLRTTMTQLERSLEPARFVRIHRTVIVNTDRVREIRADAFSDFEVILTTGRMLRMSRRYRHRLMP
jgi:two-component system, LytTR family, response regulator